MRTVLLVGDDCASRERCRDFMERSGCRAVVSKCAGEALGMIAGVRPDLLILDERPPDVPGDKAAEWVLVRCSVMPVILRTDAPEQGRTSCDWPLVAVVSRSHGLLRLRRAVARASARQIAMVGEDVALGP